MNSSSRIRISQGNFSYFMHDLDAERNAAPSIQAPFPGPERLCDPSLSLLRHIVGLQSGC